jgi:hypothetical protein
MLGQILRREIHLPQVTRIPSKIHVLVAAAIEVLESKSRNPSPRKIAEVIDAGIAGVV